MHQLITLFERKLVKEEEHAELLHTEADPLYLLL